MKVSWKFQDSFNVKDIEAPFKDGLLRIIVPPTEESKARDIPLS